MSIKTIFDFETMTDYPPNTMQKENVVYGHEWELEVGFFRKQKDNKNLRTVLRVSLFPFAHHLALTGSALALISTGPPAVSVVKIQLLHWESASMLPSYLDF